jgi:hypothetical protein
MSACLQRFECWSQRANLPSVHEPAWLDRKGMGRAGRRCRPAVSAGRLGERLGLRPGQGRLPAWFQVAAELPARLPGPPARHPGQGHGRLTARLCPDRASYAADVGHWLEHRPDARTARGRLFRVRRWCRQRVPGMPVTGAGWKATPARGTGRSSSSGRTGARALAAKGRGSRSPGSATPGQQVLAAVLVGPSPALPPL